MIMWRISIYLYKGVIVEDKGNVTQSSIVLEPGVGSCYSHGWRQMWKFFVELLLIGNVGFIISIPTGMGVWIGDQVIVNVFSLFAFIYNILLIGPVDYGISFAHLKAARGDKIEIQDMFEAFRNYWNAVLANILVGVIVVIGLILLIIPGIIFACKLVFTPYLVVDRKMEVFEAVKESWRMTNGHAWKVFFIGLIAIPICIIGLILFGVGIILSIMWIRLTLASLYHSVSTSGEVIA